MRRPVRRSPPSCALLAPRRRSARMTRCAISSTGPLRVNNAGTEGKPGPLTQQTAESYAATFDTNVLGTILSMKHELRAMQAQGGGGIINISSTFGHGGAA